MVCVLVLAAALQDPCPFCHDEFESWALAAGAAVCAGGVIGHAVPAHAAGLASDGDTLLLAVLALPNPALRGKAF
jgi:hypothetical protein